MGPKNSKPYATVILQSPRGRLITAATDDNHLVVAVTRRALADAKAHAAQMGGTHTLAGKLATAEVKRLQESLAALTSGAKSKKKDPADSLVETCRQMAKSIKNR